MLRCEQTTPDRLDAAFAVLQATAEWLRESGRRQRVGGTTRQDYDRWQCRGENFVVVEDDVVVGVFSMCRQLMSEWPEAVAADKEVLCLRALATHPQHRHKDIGRFAVREAIRIADGETIYLDCVNGFLPQFYASLGFEEVANQVLELDAIYDIRLMRFASVAESG